MRGTGWVVRKMEKMEKWNGNGKKWNGNGKKWSENGKKWNEMERKWNKMERKWNNTFQFLSIKRSVPFY